MIDQYISKVVYIYIPLMTNPGIIHQGAAIRPIDAPGEIRSRTYDPMGSLGDPSGIVPYRLIGTRNFNYKN